MTNRPTDSGSLEGFDFESARRGGFDIDVHCMTKSTGSSAEFPDSPSPDRTFVFLDRDLRAGVSGLLKDPPCIPIKEFNGRSSHFAKIAHYNAVHLKDSAPCIMTSTAIGDLDTYEKLLPQNNPDVTTSPLLVEITKPSEITGDILRKVSGGEIQGFLVPNEDIAQNLRDRWDKYAIANIEDPIPIPPFVIQSNTTRKILEQGSWKSGTNALLFRDEIDDLCAVQKFIDSRFKGKTGETLINPYSNPDKGDSLNIAIIDVQGGARLEARALMRASELVNFNVTPVLVRTRGQIEALITEKENLLGIVFPGGWHRIQSARQQKYGIDELAYMTANAPVPVYLSCAGAILGRAPDRVADDIRSEGCQAGSELSLGDYTIENDRLKGPVDTRLKKKGGTNEWSNYFPAMYSNGPIITNINKSGLPRSVEPIGETINGDVVAVASTDPDWPMVATSVHNRRMMLHWLNQLEVLLQTIHMRKVADTTEGDILD